MDHKKVNVDILNTLSKVAEANEEYPRARLAAAIVKGNRIISIGINRKKTHPLQKKFSKHPEAVFLHAEIHAIKNSLRELSVDELKNTTMYIVRVKQPRTHTDPYVWALAKPCPGCERAILEFGIKNVVYTEDNDKYCIA